LAADAGRSLEPEELARGDISRSREIAAAAANDLADHEQWLKQHLAAAERSRRRHLRWVEREQARERRKSKLQRMARAGTRAVLVLGRSARAVRRTLREEGAHTFGQMRHVTLCGAAWLAPKARTVSTRTLAGLSSAVTSAGVHCRALANIAGATAATSLAWARATSLSLADAWREKTLTSWSWLAAKASILALASREAASRRASWTIARGRDLALTLRRTIPAVSASVVASIRDLASFSAAAAASAASSTWGWSRRFAFASWRSAAMATIANARSLTRDLLGAASTGLSWVQAKSRHVLLELRHAASMASSAIREAARDAAVRLPARRSAAKNAVLRQSERAFLLIVRLRAQILAESDALSRAWRASPARR